MWLQLVALIVCICTAAYALFEFMNEPRVDPSIASLIGMGIAWKLTASSSSSKRKRDTKPECYQCNTPDPKLRCSRCKAIWYCNERCQVEDWPDHKSRCLSFEEVSRKRDELFALGKEILDEVNSKTKASVEEK